VNLGSTFKEKLNIHPLLPYEGDVIYEGRWGNSIRLGSTVKNSYTKNDWSEVGENGDPIVIIRNGQTNYNNLDPWIPITEDINRDSSDIWLTSTQKIPITPGSNLTNSYNPLYTTEAPEDPRVYNKNQIVLNSGRLVFNAKDDAIILGAKTTIHLTADSTVNIDAINSVTIDSPEVYLGSSRGLRGIDVQPAVMGDDLNKLLNEIADYLTVLGQSCTSATDSLGVPIVSLLTNAGPKALTLAASIKSKTANKKLVSNIVKIAK
jgi:hypothetical protein